MSAEASTTELQRRGRVATALRWLGILAAAGFVGLLLYGLMAQAPNRRIEDALARAEAVDAPGFELDVLQRGRSPARLAPVVDRATADDRVAPDRAPLWDDRHPGDVLHQRRRPRRDKGV